MAARTTGTLLLLAAILIIVVGSYFAYRSGCLFDSKQGYGSYAASLPFVYASLVSALVALAALATGSMLLAGKDFANRATAVTLSLLIGIPLLWSIGARTEWHGTATCHAA
jgi:hypothetical protein